MDAPTYKCLKTGELLQNICCCRPVFACQLPADLAQDAHDKDAQAWRVVHMLQSLQASC
jgi:hypothetical protein